MLLTATPICAAASDLAVEELTPETTPSPDAPCRDRGPGDGCCSYNQDHAVDLVREIILDCATLNG